MHMYTSFASLSDLMMGKTPMELFKVGGPIMWPMILLSFVAVTVVVERVIFAIREGKRRNRKDISRVITAVSQGDIAGAIQIGKGSTDFVAQILSEALEHKEGSMEDAFGRAASERLSRYSQGLPALDFAITAAPLVGLLGTVTGMMNAFGKISGALDAGAVTGGIAEALVATAGGLLIAILCLIPFNYLNSTVEENRREVEEAGHSLELALRHLQLGTVVDAEAAAEEVSHGTAPEANA